MDSITSKEPSTSFVPKQSPLVVRSGVMCTMCSRKFASIKLLNRHKRRIHKIVSALRKSRIICPLCEERQDLKTHELLRIHLVEDHEINLELLVLQFSNIQEYESWKKEENLDSGYVMYNTNRCNDYKEVNYICNRSDCRGYQANYQRRREKSGGTIKIQGMCPSKLTSRLYDNGIVHLTFWKTHVGHERELRSLHLSKLEQDIIVNKMKSGIPIDVILEDARNIKGPELQRINLINRNNIIYLARKHNIDKKRHHNAALNIQEWNGDEKKSVVFYKQEAKTVEENSVVVSLEENPVIESLEENSVIGSLEENSVIESLEENSVIESLEENSVIESLEENSVIESLNEEEIEQLIEEEFGQQTEKLGDQEEREVIWTNFKNWVKLLSDEDFNRFMNDIQEAIRETDQAKQRLSIKRIMETQELLPTKKR